MPDSLPPVAKSSSDPELRPSEGSEPGTVDRLNEAPSRETLILCAGYLIGMSLRPDIDADDRRFLSMAGEWMRTQLCDGQPGKW